MTSKEIVGENVREFRKLQGYTIQSFAAHSGIHDSFYSSIERGERNLSMDTLDRLATALKVPAPLLLVEGAYKWVTGFEPPERLALKRGKNKSAVTTRLSKPKR